MQPFTVPAAPAAAPARVRAPGGGWTDLRNVYLILAGCVAVLVLLPPAHEYPIIDDWVYAGSVQHQLATGVFQLPAPAQLNLVGLTLWGTAWASLFGFSYTTLTYSTLTLAAVALLVFYALLRRVAVPPAGALVGTALIGLNPLFLHLSYSFMTDVPWLALVLIACYGYVRGLDGGHAAWLVPAGLAAGAAFLIRQTGVLAPAGFLLYLAWDGWRTRRPRRRAIALIALVPAVIFAGWWLWSHDMPPTPWMALAARLRARFLWQPAWLRVGLIRSLMILPVAALSAWGAIKLRPARWWLVALAALLVGGGMLWTNTVGEQWIDMREPPFVWRIGSLAVTLPQQPFSFGAMGNILRVGGIDFFQYRQAPIWSPEAWRALFVFAALLGVLLVAKLIDGAWDGLQHLRAGRPLAPVVGLYLVGAIMFGVEVALGADWYDRYLLAFLPFLILFVVRGAAGWRRPAWAYSIAACVLWAAFSLALNADAADHDNARWQAVAWLQARGANPVQMGYDWNPTHGAGNGTYEVTDVPIPGFRTEARFPYVSRLSGFSTRTVLVQARADRPRLRP